ncbi:hypothetical protein MWU65_17190 [Cellulophaga sp. F20128]|jgi:hypothetical protein|uniref:hypothetical protein n=1 Tax=Cellulophaga sp. F20128 TaxID=2926413 RepID=UPI001FF3C122|nr:hypothetical protein [Cellulophaga sp. F20128]MCK0158926.1 hypothetical protein [Cellulophaga sp. F20128]
MQKLSYELVLDQKTVKYDIGVSEKFYYIGIAGLILVFFFNWLLESYTEIILLDIQLVKYIMYSFIICLIIGSLYGLVDKNGNNRIIKGFITFDENEITINYARKYNLTEIKNLKFSGHDHKGRLINLHSDGDPTRSYGGDNYVEFSYRDKNYKFQFVVDSISHRKLLTEKVIPKMKTKAEIKY